MRKKINQREFERCWILVLIRTPQDGNCTETCEAHVTKLCEFFLHWYYHLFSPKAIFLVFPLSSFCLSVVFILFFCWFWEDITWNKKYF